MSGEGCGYGRGSVGLVGVELARGWDGCRVGMVVGRESLVWRAVRMRSGVGGEDLVLYGDLSGVALPGYIHSSPYTIPTPDTPHFTPPHPTPTHIPNQNNSSYPNTSSLPPLYAHLTTKTLITPNEVHVSL